MNKKNTEFVTKIGNLHNSFATKPEQMKVKLIERKPAPSAPAKHD